MTLLYFAVEVSLAETELPSVVTSEHIRSYALLNKQSYRISKSYSLLITIVIGYTDKNEDMFHFPTSHLRKHRRITTENWKHKNAISIPFIDIFRWFSNKCRDFMWFWPTKTTFILFMYYYFGTSQSQHVIYSAQNNAFQALLQ